MSTEIENTPKMHSLQFSILGSSLDKTRSVTISGVMMIHVQVSSNMLNRPIHMSKRGGSLKTKRKKCIRFQHHNLTMILCLDLSSLKINIKTQIQIILVTQRKLREEILFLFLHPQNRLTSRSKDGVRLLKELTKDRSSS